MTASLPTASPVHTFALTCHPATPSAAVRRIEVQVLPPEGKGLTLRYLLDADVARVLIPGAGEPGRADELWRHTCFEAFVRAHANARASADQDEGYCELNFSPSMQWAMYRFSGYRQGMTALDAPLPRIRTQREATRFMLEASIAPAALAFAGSGLCLALAAVIEESGARLSYWALAHAPGRPDFHHPAGFMVTLPVVTACTGPVGER